MNAYEPLQPAPLSGCNAKRICLIKPSSLGDVVQALPVFQALRERFPAAEISWVVNRAYAPLIRPVPGLDRVIEFDRQSFKTSNPLTWTRFRTFLKDLRASRFDLVVDLQGLFRSGLMTWATKAPIRIGLSSAREGAGLFYSHLADDSHSESQAAVDRYWKVADLLGVGNRQKKFPLGISASEKQWAQEQLEGLPRPLLAVNPGARWQTKQWPPERFAKVANLQLRVRGGSAVVLGGPGEDEMADACLKNISVPARNLCGRMNLRQLTGILSQCELLLTNDTGPMHLASAVGTPTVSIFTCTSPERAAPYGEQHQQVQTKVHCRGSYLRHCSRMECLCDLTVPRIEQVVQKSLDDVAAESALPLVSESASRSQAA